MEKQSATKAHFAGIGVLLAAGAYQWFGVGEMPDIMEVNGAIQGLLIPLLGALASWVSAYLAPQNKSK